MFFERLAYDIRFALRRLRRSPAFTITALTCIALGVGVTTAMFSAVNGLLVRALPFPQADDLVAIHAASPQRGVNGGRISWADSETWRTESHSFAQLGVWGTYFPTLSGEAFVERVPGAQVSVGLLPLLGASPLPGGRAFSDDDARQGAADVVLLSHALWQGHYGGDRTLVGRTVQINFRACLVLGIMPPGFDFPERAQLWTPLIVDAAREKHGNRSLAGAVGRLIPGQTFSAAKSELAQISARLAEAFPQDNTGWEAEPVPLRDDLVGPLRRPILILFGAAGFVLLIACANVANLLLARGAARQREMAVRVAIGAARGRIVRQVLTESVLLAAAGGVLGTLLAYLGVQLMTLAFPDGVPSYFRIAIDIPGILFTMIVSLATGIVFGLVPALRATRVDLGHSLREGPRGAAGSVGHRMRTGLVLAEVALSLVLLIGATLLIRSDLALEGELGFTSAGVLTVRIPLPSPQYDNAGRRTFYEELFNRVGALPGVTAVGSAQGLPFGPLGGSYERATVAIDGVALAQDADTLRQQISTRYFAALGVSMISGRSFSRGEEDAGAPVAVVNEMFVRRYLAGQNPLDRRIKFTGGAAPAWITILGVVKNVRQDRPPAPVEPAVFVPYQQGSQTIVIGSTARDPLTLLPAVRSIVREMDPRAPTYLAQTLDHVVHGVLWRQRLQGQILGVFAALALLLALFGIYAVISYTVAQRSAELGVRLALGATRGQVMTLVLKQGARLALAGVLIGIPAALLLTRLLAGLLYEVRPADPATFVATSTVLCVVGVVAVVIPARRAARVDPLVAMRAE